MVYVAQWLSYICKQKSSVFSMVTGLIAEVLLLPFFITEDTFGLGLYLTNIAKAP